MRISFIGDIMTGGHQVSFSRELEDHLAQSDIVIGNLEGPVTLAQPRKDKPNPLHMEPTIGFFSSPNLLDVAILANNHIMDHGSEGLIDTRRYLDDLLISYVGAGLNIREASKPLLLKKNGIRICIIAFCHNEGPMAAENTPGPCPLFTEDVLIKNLRQFKKENDLLLLSYHGGEEFFTVPWKRRRNLFKSFIQSGVDIVFGHHAHLVQGYEKIAGAVIIYSAGNFYMNTAYQLSNPGTEYGVVFDVRYNPINSSLNVSYIPTYADHVTQKVIIAKGHRKEQTENIINKSCKCLTEPELYSKEWNCQSFNRFVGRYGWFGTIFRLCRFAWSRRRSLRKSADFLEKRDRDILIGALHHIFSKYRAESCKQFDKKLNV